MNIGIGMKSTRLLATCFFGLGMLSFQESLLACSCVPPSPPKQAVEEADAVFLGTVEKFEIDKPPAPEGNAEGEAKRIATVRVRVSWKGVEDPIVRVATALYGPTCGYDFIVGADYLVYADRVGQNLLVTSTCSRTKPVGATIGDVRQFKAKEDLEALGQGKLFEQTGSRGGR